MAKKFKKYYTDSSQTNGKGSWRRPSEDEQRLAENWCHAFGHRTREGTDTCYQCGAKTTPTT